MSVVNLDYRGYFDVEIVFKLSYKEVTFIKLSKRI